MKKLHGILIICLLVVAGFLLGGCGGRTPAPVATEKVSIEYARHQQSIGQLYRYIKTNLPLSPEEQASAKKAYEDILDEVQTLSDRSIGGKVEYHRLKYFVEDVRPLYRDLRGVLDGPFKVVAESPDTLLDEFAMDKYYSTRAGVERCFTLAEEIIVRAESDANRADMAELSGIVVNLYENLGPYFEKAVDLAL